MNLARLSLFSLRPLFRLRRDQRGAVAMLVGVSIVALVGMSTLVVDASNVINAQRTLQASSDAAAMAAAQDIGSAHDPVATATTYSSVATNLNAHGNLPGVTISTTLRCFTSTGVTCTGSPLANGIVVTQQATVPTFLGSVVGVRSMNISATATAGARGGKSQPVDVMIILDTTQSMTTSDSSCAATRMDCALGGVRALLSGFWPTVDQVGLMVFPGVTNATVSKDYDCSTTNPTIVAYNNSPVYQIIPLTANYRLTNTALLDQTANIVKAARGGASGCTQGIVAIGGQGTFYADAITLARTALTAGRANVQKAIILLSDGDASASNVPTGEQTNQCQQAIDNAKLAKDAGTWVYSVAYGASTSSSSSCGSDSPHISACSTMQKIAQPTGTSDLSKFFSSTSACASPHTISDLTQIFQNIGTDLTSARLLRNDAS
jgi:Flp pilus assembly protein TadG